jgi:hypothetical protein
MKYENFEQVKKLIEQIAKHKATLEIINSEPIIKIERPFTSDNISIETINEDRVDMGCYALDFLAALREDVQNRIETLKGMLELL